MKMTEKILFFCILIPQISLGNTFFESSKAFCKPSGYTTRIPKSASTLLSFSFYTQKNNRYLAPIYLKFEELKKALKEIISGEEKNRLLISNDEEFKRLCITIQEGPEKNNLLFERNRKLSRFLNQKPTIAIQDPEKTSHVDMLEPSSREIIHDNKKTTSPQPLKKACYPADFFAQLKRPTDPNYWKKPITIQHTQTDFPTQDTKEASLLNATPSKSYPSSLSVCFFALTKLLS